jgi:flagellar protein FliO/FliZ
MDWGWLLTGLFFVLLLTAAILTGLWSYRAFATGDTSLSFAWLFPPRPEPRLGVMEEARVDRSRKLVLIRRDDVEHLIMTGGPVDVVIETGIAIPRQEAADLHDERQEPAPPVFARKPRGFGQAVNE